jgi:replicative DNA helicase
MVAKTRTANADSKIPPQNVKAESSLLGAILLDAEAFTKIADRLSESAFYEQRHKTIFKCMSFLYEKQRPIDVLTVSEQLENIRELESVGGSAYITELANSVPSAAHIGEYADIVTHKATLRRLISAAQEMLQLGYDENTPIDALLDRAERSIFEISQHNLRGNFRSISDVLAANFDRLDELHKDKNKLRGVPTGFKDLDKVLAGLQNSDLIILAARPSLGKTTLALNIAHHVSVKEGIPVGIFSLEMSQEQLVDRLLAAQANIDSWKIRTGDLDDADFQKLGDAMGALSEAPIYIDDSPMLNSMEMRTKARRIQSEQGLGLLIVDYLQLMSSGSSGEGRVQEVSEISRGLKALARELNIPVIAISQLSRSVESRTPQIPQLADLRESGSIEQDADVVAFIYREEVYNPDTERHNIADVLIKKHRNGPTGKIELYFNPEKLLFRTLEKSRK